MSSRNTLVADNVEAVAAIRETADVHLPLCRFPAPGEPRTPEAIRPIALADDLGLRVSALGDLLAWAAANPKAGAELAARLGGDPNIAVHEEDSRSEILVLANGSAMLWSDVRGICSEQVTDQVLITTDPVKNYFYAIDVDEFSADMYRDELIAQWKERR